MCPALSPSETSGLLEASADKRAPVLIYPTASLEKDRCEASDGGADVRVGSRAAVARCGERVSLAPESRPTASSINHLFSASKRHPPNLPLTSAVDDLMFLTANVLLFPLAALGEIPRGTPSAAEPSSDH
jgi:hypothetical protein